MHSNKIVSSIRNIPLNKEFAIAPHGAIGLFSLSKAKGKQSEEGTGRNRPKS